MATQKEILEEQYVADLKEFAAEKGVELDGATRKDDIVAKLVASKKVTADEINAAFEDPDDSSHVVDEEEPAGGSGSVPQATGAGDPALLGDVAEAQAEKFEGRTSDPATRAEGVALSEVGTDRSEGPKSSDAGDDAYPFPQGGDVDVSLVDPGKSKEEYPAPLNVDDWVVLDGAHELVPDRLDGHIAYIIDAPSEVAPDVYDHPNAARTPVPDAGITVRTRDETNATLVLPFEAFKAVGKGGRSAVLPIG